MLRRMVADHPDVEYIVGGDRRLTFAEVDRQSREIARHLVAHGIGKASRVAMMCTQGPDWAVSFLGIARTGAIAVPLSTFYAPAELRHTLRNGDVEHLIMPSTMFGNDTQPYVESAVAELRDATGALHLIPGLPFLRRVTFLGETDRSWALSVDPERRLDDSTITDDLLDAIESEVTPADLLVMVHTSGTTSDPKGVLHTHGTQVRHGATMSSLRPTGVGDKVLAVMPFFWIGGLTCTFLPALHAGSTLLCLEKFDTTSALDLIERERPAAMMAWPSVRVRLKRDPTYADRDLGDIAFLDPPGSPDVDPGLVHNSLGMTETSGPHSAAGPASATESFPKSCAVRSARASRTSSTVSPIR